MIPCRVLWISGNLKGLEIITSVNNPYIGKMVKPYGVSGEFRVLSILAMANSA